MFITFDRPNGAGKSTIINELSSYLKSKNLRVYVTKEPYETDIGNFIRESEEKYSSYTLANLVAADRHNHLKTEILPVLESGDIVLCDRYVASSLILQVLDGLSMNEVMNINTGVLVPDITVIVYASVETLKKRLSKRVFLTRFERSYESRKELELSFAAGEFLEGHNYDVVYVNTDELVIDYIQKLGDLIIGE